MGKIKNTVVGVTLVLPVALVIEGVFVKIVVIDKLPEVVVVNVLFIGRTDVDPPKVKKDGKVDVKIDSEVYLIIT